MSSGDCEDEFFDAVESLGTDIFSSCKSISTTSTKLTKDSKARKKGDSLNFRTIQDDDEEKKIDSHAVSDMEHRVHETIEEIEGEKSPDKTKESMNQQRKEKDGKSEKTFIFDEERTLENCTLQNERLEINRQKLPRLFHERTEIQASARKRIETDDTTVGTVPSSTSGMSSATTRLDASSTNMESVVDLTKTTLSPRKKEKIHFDVTDNLVPSRCDEKNLKEVVEAEIQYEKINESMSNMCTKAFDAAALCCTYKCSNMEEGSYGIERPLFKRSESMLSNLLSGPGGKQTSTARVDPRVPPSDCPPTDPMANSTTTFLKRNSPNAVIKRSLNNRRSSSSGSFQGTLGCSPTIPLKSNVSFNSPTSHPNVIDQFSSFGSNDSFAPNSIGSSTYEGCSIEEHSIQDFSVDSVDPQTTEPSLKPQRCISNSTNHTNGEKVNARLRQPKKLSKRLKQKMLLHVLKKNANNVSRSQRRLLCNEVEKDSENEVSLKSGIMKKKGNVRKKRQKEININLMPANSVPMKSKNLKHQSTDNLNHDDPMLLIQNLPSAHNGAIWCCTFSPDAKYLATGGEDKVIHIWCMSNNRNKNPCLSLDEHLSHSMGAHTEDKHVPVMVGGHFPLGKELQLFSSSSGPFQTHNEHIGDIVDLSWSNSTASPYFILSASVDKTVKLWHISRCDSLLTFQHSDLVTSVQFHPYDENYFVSAGFDKKLRLWDIPNERVLEWAKAPEIITCGRFTPDGKYIVVGLITGQVYFYSCVLETSDRATFGSRIGGLQYYTQIACRNRFGSAASGKKVTGLAFVKAHPVGSFDEKNVATSITDNLNKYHLLVTTNDSRLRLFGMDDFCMIRKYKGLVNNSYMINAHCSESGEHVICGSESGHVYIWPIDSKDKDKAVSSRVKTGKQNDYEKNNSYEVFEAARSPVFITEAYFVPSTRLTAVLLESNLFPTLKALDNLKYDMGNAMVVTCDYGGSVRVFLRKSCLDAIYFAAGPEGNPDDQVAG